MDPESPAPDAAPPRAQGSEKVKAEHLATFCLAARHESVSRTAEALGLSQPAVSRQLRILQDAYGVSLYDPTPTGIALTPAGHVLLPYACEVHDALRMARRFLAGELPPSHAAVRVGLSHHLTTRFTGPLLQAAKRYGADGSEMELHLLEAYSRDLVAAVQEGRLDAAYILRAEPYDLERMQVRRMGSEPLVLLVKPDDPLAHERGLRLGDLVGETIVLPSMASEVFRRVREAMDASGLEAGRMLEVSGPAAVRGAVMDGLGIGVTLESFIAADVRSGALRAIRVDDPRLMADVCAIARHETRLFPWQRRALAALREGVGAPTTA